MQLAFETPRKGVHPFRAIEANCGDLFFDAVDHVLEDFDEQATKAKADRRPAGWVVDDTGIYLGDAALHGLNEDAGVIESCLARIADNEAVGIDHARLAIATKTHTSKIALM